MIAIIPARGGSKGVPKKNIRHLCGKPLIYYTIKAAQESKEISRVIISTDDEEIANIARELGAEVPFLRPKELAADKSKAIDAYIYTVEELEKIEGTKIESFLVLLPTSPLRTSKDIDDSIRLFDERGAKTVISVCPAEHPPSWYKKIDAKGILIDYFENNENSFNRQESEKTYLPNGAIYIFNTKSLKENYNYYNEKTYPFIMETERSVDIDNELDFRFAELLIGDLLNECND